jgi:glucosamine kinase
MAGERAVNPDGGSTLAIDAGQTGIRAVLVDAASGRADAHEFPGILTHSALIPQLASIVSQMAASTGTTIARVSAGVSGLTAEESDPAQLRDLSRTAGVTAAYLAHDSVTSYLGALGDELGAVVAAGTGVVTLGVGRSAVARVDGWGNIMGDAGSGYWIGRAAFDAVMRAHDGRGPATALTEVVKAEFPDLEQAYVDLQGDPGRVRRIAAYSRAVAERAGSDNVAAQICAEAASQLVLSVATALRRVDETTAPVVCMIGGVFRSTAIRSHFEAELRELWPQVDLRAPIGTGLDGAALLPALGEHSALRPLIAVAQLS